MSLEPWKKAWQLVVAAEDRGLQLVLSGYPPGCCFPVASQARSGEIVPVEAWAGSWCSGDSSTMAMNGECGFDEKEASPPCSRVGFRRVLGTSTGAVPGSGAQVALVVVMGPTSEPFKKTATIHAVFCGVVGTLAATPRRPRHTDGRDWDARPRSLRRRPKTAAPRLSRTGARVSF